MQICWSPLAQLSTWLGDKLVVHHCLGFDCLGAPADIASGLHSTLWDLLDPHSWFPLMPLSPWVTELAGTWFTHSFSQLCPQSSANISKCHFIFSCQKHFVTNKLYLCKPMSKYSFSRAGDLQPFLWPIILYELFGFQMANHTALPVRYH